MEGYLFEVQLNSVFLQILLCYKGCYFNTNGNAKKYKLDSLPFT